MHKLLFCIIFLSFYLPSNWANDNGNSVENTLQKMSSKGAYGKLLIAKGKHIMVNQAFGSPAHKKKLNSQFMIGSISKIFTAVAIFKLREKNQIDLNQPISTYLPDDDTLWQGKPPPWIHKVSVQNLLSHSGGIQEYLNIKGFDSFYDKIQTTQNVMQFISQAALTFSPGSKYEYNGTGYLILGAIIERISAKSYGNFIKDEFLEPLKLNETIAIHDRFLFDLFEENKKITHGFNLEDEKLLPALNVNLSTVFSEACIISSIEDLYKWSYALFHGQVINQSSLAKMLKPQMKRKDGFMGSGVFMGETPNHNKVIFHDGNINGYQAFLIFVPEKDIIIIMLSCVRNWESKEFLFEIVDQVASE